MTGDFAENSASLTDRTILSHTNSICDKSLLCRFTALGRNV
jgi:hypothetical protein